MLKNIDSKKITDKNRKLKEAYLNTKMLIDELSSRKLDSNVVAEINKQTEAINDFSENSKKLRKQIQKSRRNILGILRTRLKIVPKNYYRNVWMAIGLAVFGIPIGVGLGLALNNMAFIGTGIAIGLPFGLAVGAILDKKSREEGRQLNFEERF